MPFNKEQSRVPADIGRVTLSVAILKGATTLSAASVNFSVVDAADAEVAQQTHDALPHLTAAQKTALFNLLSAIYTKAKNEAVGP